MIGHLRYGFPVSHARLIRTSKAPFASPLLLRFPNVGLTLFLGESSTLLKYQERSMRDLIFAICTIVFFTVSILYLRACERLK